MRTRGDHSNEMSYTSDIALIIGVLTCVSGIWTSLTWHVGLVLCSRQFYKANDSVTPKIRLTFKVVKSDPKFRNYSLATYFF